MCISDYNEDNRERSTGNKEYFYNFTSKEKTKFRRKIRTTEKRKINYYTDIFRHFILLRKKDIKKKNVTHTTKQKKRGVSKGKNGIKQWSQSCAELLNAGKLR